MSWWPPPQQGHWYHQAPPSVPPYGSAPPWPPGGPPPPGMPPPGLAPYQYVQYQQQQQQGWQQYPQPYGAWPPGAGYPPPHQPPATWTQKGDPRRKQKRQGHQNEKHHKVGKSAVKEASAIEQGRKPTAQVQFDNKIEDTKPVSGPAASTPVGATDNSAVGGKRKGGDVNQVDKTTKRQKRQKSFDVGVSLAPRYLAAHSVGTSPEEVRAWREARRKNYPTQANIEEKTKRVEQAPQANNSSSPPRCENEATADKQDETISASNEMLNPAAKKDRKKNVCFKYLRGQCRRSGDNCHYLHDDKERAAHRINERKKAEKRQFLTATARPGGCPSLLRKLLASDIEKERAVVLQCLHHLLVCKARETC